VFFFFTCISSNKHAITIGVVRQNFKLRILSLSQSIRWWSNITKMEIESLIWFFISKVKVFFM